MLVRCAAVQEVSVVIGRVAGRDLGDVFEHLRRHDTRCLLCWSTDLDMSGMILGIHGANSTLQCLLNPQ